MVKEGIIFAGSVCVLALFLVPDDEGPRPETAPAEKPIEKKQPQSDEDDGWDYDESEEDEDEDEDSNFTFGEPLVTEDPSDSEQYDSEVRAPEPTTPSKTKSSTSRNLTGVVGQKAPKSSKTPQPGEPGSKENPINLSPTGPRE